MSRIVLVCLSVLVGLTSCTKSPENAAPVGQAAAPEASKAGGAEREVNLAIWANYLPPDIEAQVLKATGVRLKISHFSSNEELLAKIQAGATGIDVAVPSDYMVDILAKTDQLEPLDKAQIPNAAGVDPKLLKQPFDPENKFSIPFAWTTAGIAINRELYKGQLKSWKDVFATKDLAGKISFLDDVRETMAPALKANGYSVNSTNPEELKKAQATLKEFRPRLKMFRSDTIDLLVNKEVSVAQTYSIDALRANRKLGGDHITYFIPEEGGTIAIDNMVILKSAKNKTEALALINFFLKPETNIEFVKSVLAGPVLTGTRAALPKELQENQALFPSDATRKKLESIHDVGEATRLYDRAWTELKTE